MRLAFVFLLIPAIALAQAADDRVYLGRQVVDVIDGFRDQGHAFVYSTNLIDDDLEVTIEPDPESSPLAIVREILEPYGLTVRVEGQVLLVVRLEREVSDAGDVLIVVVGDGTDLAIQDAKISFGPDGTSPRQLKPGVYDFEELPAGRYDLRIEAAGFDATRRRVRVRSGETRIINIRMENARPEIETISVSASRYQILRDIAASSFSLDRRTIENMPDFGDDPLRAVQRLPGAAAGGASAKTHLRGGDRDEIGIMLNGQKLFDPFHVRDYQSIFSVIDSRAIEGVEVYTGGFPVRYGNRMSGMVLMESLEPLDDRHTEIGVSVYNTSVLTAGRSNDSSWLISARRGNLDLVIDPEYGSPSYYDVFGEFVWDLSPDMTLSVNALYADDRVEIILESEPEELERVVSTTDNAQLWLQLTNRWSEALSSKTVLSATFFDNLRRGSLGDEEKIVASVFDDRRVEQIGFRQDFTFNPSDRHLLQWGLQVQRGRADYLYRNSAEYFGLQALFEGRDEPASRDLSASPEGSSYALYFADRWVLSPTTMFEWGLRWDDQTYTAESSDSQLSPRLSVLRRLGERTELRVSWGRYHQAQEINELQIEDGVTRFWPAQRADHFIVGLRHTFFDRYLLRLEYFDKVMRDVQPRFENLFDPLGLIPEIQPDRVRLQPDRANSKGVEITLDRTSGPLNWWATYVWSRATDRIDGRSELRSWDQRHAFQGGISWTGDQWEWGIAANVHSGWPLTELMLIEDGFDEDGEIEYVAVPGARNAGRHDTFASLDIRIARHWDLPRGSLTAFLEVSNLLNRRNTCCLDFDLEEDEATGEDVFERGLDYWMPLLPAIGILWEF